jgi:hypothetical protein
MAIPLLLSERRLLSNWTILRSQSQSHSYFTTGGLQPISSSWRQAPWDPRPEFLFYNRTLAVFVLMLHPTWRQDGFVVYNCCWSSPAQSFSGPNPARLVTIFYCLRFETLPTWRARSLYLYPPGTGWPCYTQGTGFPFRRLLRLAGLRWRYSTPPPHGMTVELLLLQLPCL